MPSTVAVVSFIQTDMTQRAPPVNSYGVHSRYYGVHICCYATRGVWKPALPPWSRGAMDSTARWLTEQQQTRLFGHRATCCTAPGSLPVCLCPRWFLLSLLLRPPAKRSTRIFPVWQCWRWHVSVTGAQRCYRKRGEGGRRGEPSWEGDYGYLIVLARRLA